MKPIKLTDLHKSKLLEMCKYLFLEFKEYNQQEDYSGKWLEDKIWFEINKKLIGIHWFEFCMTKLQHEIRKMFIPEKSNSDEGYFNFTIEDVLKNHPVDYLYEQFKQLKINK